MSAAMMEEASSSFGDAALKMELEQECQQRKKLDTAVIGLLASRKTLEAELDETRRLSDQVDRDCAKLDGERKNTKSSHAVVVQHELDNVTKAHRETEALKRALTDAEARETSLGLQAKELREKIIQQEKVVKEANQTRQSKKMSQQRSVVALLTELKQVRAELKKTQSLAASKATGPPKVTAAKQTLVVPGQVKRAAATPPGEKSTELAAERTSEKKQKSSNDWIGHSMNIQEAIVESHREKFLSDIANADVSVLQGIGVMETEAFRMMRLKTVRDLGGEYYRSPHTIWLNHLPVFCSFVSKRIQILQDSKSHQHPGRKRG